MVVPKYRTGEYLIWRTCERMNIKPPGVCEDWDENDIWTQALLLGYGELRNYEDAQI